MMSEKIFYKTKGASFNMHKKSKLPIILSAVSAGAVNGILGTGGGIILAIFLSRLLKNEKEAFKSALCVTLLATFLMSFAGAVFHLSNNVISFKDVLPYLPASIIGGLAGAFIFSKIKPKLLNIIFSLLIIFAGIRMLLP